jgi:hypothetical protein
MFRILEGVDDPLAAKLTPTQQRNGVSEGVALGILMCGHNELPHDKIGIDFAFDDAWRGWSYRDRFPQVSTDMSKGGDGTRIMTRADEGKQTFDFYWEASGKTLRIMARASWQDAEVVPSEAAATIAGNVPAEAWKSLAEDFLARLFREGKRS